MTFEPSLEAPGPPHPESLWFVVRSGEVLVVERDETVTIPRRADLDGIVEDDPHYLGVLRGVACWASAIAAGAEPPTGMAFSGLRPLFDRIEDGLFGVAGRALQLVEWEQTHRYCGRCGTPTERAHGERAMRCPACRLLAFPRVAPAIIVRVTRGERILLAHGSRFPTVMYSVLAGFVDPGESLEECVQRELREEVGIEVENIRYFGSQPWPFPHSLMVGFTADWAGGELSPDPNEIADAGWYARDDMPPIPPKLSIARRLIDDWLDSARR